MQKELENSLREVIENYDNVAVLFSGGLDSTLIAKILKDAGRKFVCYTAGIKGSEDVKFAKMAASELGLELKVIELDEDRIERVLKKIVRLLKNPSVLNVSIAVPIFAVAEQAKKDGFETVLTGLGSDEIFAGYASHRKAFEKNLEEVEKEIGNRLEIVKQDLERDREIAEQLRIRIETPFLDKTIVLLGKKIAPELKISETENKIILRRIGKEIRLPKFVYSRRKKAVQYGSGAMKILKKLAKKKRITLDRLVNLYKK